MSDNKTAEVQTAILKILGLSQDNNGVFVDKLFDNKLFDNNETASIFTNIIAEYLKSNPNFDVVALKNLPIIQELKNSDQEVYDAVRQIIKFLESFNDTHKDKVDDTKLKYKKNPASNMSKHFSIEN